MNRDIAYANMSVEAAERLHDRADEMELGVFLEQAREEIIETVMNFGQYPQPRRVGMFFTSGSSRPKQFDLQEFLFDEAPRVRVDPVEAEELFVLALIDHSRIGFFEDSRNRWEKRVTEMLTEYFTAEHPLVKERAETLMADEREAM